MVSLLISVLVTTYGIRSDLVIYIYIQVLITITVVEETTELPASATTTTKASVEGIDCNFPLFSL